MIPVTAATVLALLALSANSQSLDWKKFQEKHNRLRGLPGASLDQQGITGPPLGKSSASYRAQGWFDSLARPINPTDWSSPFTAQGLAGWGVRPSVRIVGVSSNKVFANGSFAGADDVPARWVAIWDGTQWGGFGKQAPYSLHQANDMLVSGGLAYFSGRIDSLDDHLYPVRSASGNVAVWNGQTWELVVIDKDGFASALGMWNGKLLVAISETGNGALGLWHWDGSKAEAFGPRLSGLISRIETLDSRLYIAGDFVLDGDSTVRNLAVWEGDTWKKPFPGKVGPVRDMARFGDALFVLENHRNPRNENADSQAVVKWNGAMWAEVPLDAPAATLSALEADAKGLFLVATDRLQIHPPTQSGLQVSKWNGQKFQIAERKEFRGWIHSVESGPDGLILGGGFQGVGDVRADNLIQWTGAEWKPFTSGRNAGPGPWITAIASDGKRLMVGSGDLRFAGKLPTECAAAWDGTAWEAFDDPLRKRWRPPGPNQSEENTDAEVLALATWSDALVVGGVFDSSSNRELKNIARWDGIAWAPLANGYPGRVRTLAVDKGQLIVGGAKQGDMDTSGFSLAPFNGNTVARWNGSSWQALNGFKGNVWKLVVYREEIMALGENEAGFMDLVAWNGSTWRRPLARKFENGLHDMVVHQGNLMLLADSLFSWNGTSLALVKANTESAKTIASDGENLFVAARLNLPGYSDCILSRWDGKEWHALAVGWNYLYIPRNLTVHGDHLYMSAEFPEIGGRATVRSLVRWNRKTGTWSAPFSKRTPEWGPILRFNLVGENSSGEADLGTDSFGLDGKRSGGKKRSAGVSVNQRKKRLQ